MRRSIISRINKRLNLNRLKEKLQVKTVAVSMNVCSISIFILNAMFSVFKGGMVGRWRQYKNIISNMNIFGSMLSIEDMIRRTSGDDCSSPGDYLRFMRIHSFQKQKLNFRVSMCSWEEMEWKLNGNIDTGTVSMEDVCPARFPKWF